MVAPRGRPRKNCDWVDGTGWVPRAGAAPPPPKRSAVVARTVIARPIAPPPIDPRVLQRMREQQEQERLVREEEARVAKEEAARAEQERAERAERARKAAIERERLEAPRRYALQLQSRLMRSDPPPVYYFDIKGNFRELGKEPKESPPPPTKTPICKKKRVGPRRVVGPCQTKSGWLSAGESEYISD